MGLSLCREGTSLHVSSAVQDYILECAWSQQQRQVVVRTMIYSR